MPSAKNTASVADQEDAVAPGEATLLVSEYPPPPFYYRHAAVLSPPEIPNEALARGTRRAAAAAAKARAQAERNRLMGDEADKTDAILGGVEEKDESEEGDVVAVFGEVVEDPLLVKPLDPCSDPVAIAMEVKTLNQEVLRGFVKLVQDLVHRPMENKKTRDELCHNIFLMLQECNKFREHQAREVLISLLEKQLKERQALVKASKEQLGYADEVIQ